MNVYRFHDIHEFHAGAATHIRDALVEAIGKRGSASIAFTGGRTPGPVYELLASPELNIGIAWDSVHAFWSDERCVPSNHADSNYAMTEDVLLSRISIPTSNLHRARTEGASPDGIAAAYEEDLHRCFGEGRIPCFDVILLGMGADGHTASLFPGSPALREELRWVVAVDGRHAMPPVPRVTFTLPLINNARRVMFMISGDEKSRIADEIEHEPDQAIRKYPAAMIKPKGKLIWFVCGVCGRDE